MKPLFTFMFLTIFLAGCNVEDRATTQPFISEMYIEPTENQAITTDGLVVAAEDIAFGKIQLLWATDYPQSEKFRFFIYVTKEAELNDYNGFIATQLCNVILIQCSPQKQTGCQIEQGLFYCLASKTRGVNIESLIGEGETTGKVWMTLRVCPFDAAASDSSCAQASKQFVIARECSSYRQYECLDQDPLEVSNFQLRGVQINDEGAPFFDNSQISKINFYPSWDSSWLSESYRYQIDLVDSREPNNRVTLLEGTCNERTICYPVAQQQCTLFPQQSGASISCLGNAQVFQIFQIDERHPMEDVPLVFELIAFDPLFQMQTTLAVTALLVSK